MVKDNDTIEVREKSKQMAVVLDKRGDISLEAEDTIVAT